MPHYTQPIEVAQLKGADKKNPQRYRDIVPKSKLPLGEPPAHMSDDAQECWYELSFYSIPGVMTGADRVLLEVASDLLDEYRKSRVPDEEGRLPKFQVVKLGKLIECLARFGMTPSDRTKLGVDKSKADDPYDRLDD